MNFANQNCQSKIQYSGEKKKQLIRYIKRVGVKYVNKIIKKIVVDAINITPEHHLREM